MPVVLYQIPASPPCRAVMMAAEKLGVQLELKHVDLFTKEQLKPEFIAINPQHTVPTIDDDGFYLWESHAIITYLANKYAPNSSLYPKDPQKRAAVDKMLYFHLGTLFKAQMDLMRPMLFFGKEADPAQEEAYRKALALFEELLSKTTYAAADHITLADYPLYATLTMAVQVGNQSLASYPKIACWMKKVKAETPRDKEINEEPLLKVKELIESKRKSGKSIFE